MSFAKKRIQEYKRGKKPTWLEMRLLEHADPVHMILAIVGTIALIYGLWIGAWLWIILGVGLNIIGHIYAWLK
ncbi:MAG: hypothetical protein PHF86_12665 [Candidatus Nanoarchaeia archaeon]|nr:hypothetical protein [Candidatus Nanoarchaeia archaeon]